MMKLLDSFKFKMKERKNLLRLQSQLMAAVEYQTPGCGGLLKGPSGFFEEQGIQKVLEGNGIMVICFY